MANEILGAKKFLVLYNEATWSTKPGSPTYVHVPVTEYNVRFKPQNRQANPYIGLFERKHSKNFRGMPSGNLNCALYGWQHSGISQSLMQYLLDWAFGDHESQAPASKGAQWAEGPNVANKEHNGLRINGATLQGTDESGVVELSLDLQGATESALGSAQSLPNNRNKILDCEFKDVTASIGGSPVAIKQFQVQVQNGLKVEYLNSFTPSLLLKSQRVVTVQMTLVKNADTYDAYRRASTATEVALQLVIKGLHNGTGTVATDYTVATLDFARASIVDVDEQGGKEDIATQPINFVALKPDSSSHDLEIAYSEV